MTRGPNGWKHQTTISHQHSMLSAILFRGVQMGEKFVGVSEMRQLSILSAMFNQ